MTTAVVKIFDDRLVPEKIGVPPITAVTWVNEGQHSHVVRSDGGAWQTFRLQPGAQQSITFRATGLFPYTVDGVLKGLVVVAGGLRSAPPTQAPKGVFRYHVVVEGSVHTHIKWPDTTSEHPDYKYPYNNGFKAHESDTTLTWRADYPEVDVMVMEYQRAYLILLKDRWHAHYPYPGAADPQGTIRLSFDGQAPPCDVRVRLTLPAYISVGSGSDYSDPYSRGSSPTPTRFGFRSSAFDATGFEHGVDSAFRAACPNDPKAPSYGGVTEFYFPLGLGSGGEFTTADGLIWETNIYGLFQVNIYRNGGPELGIPVGLLREGRPFTLSTGKRVDDRVTCDRCRTHDEGMITVKFLR